MALGNSGMNPLIYAWKNTALRTAFGRLLRFRHPDHPAAYKSSTNRRRTRRTGAGGGFDDDRRRSSMLAIDDEMFTEVGHHIPEKHISKSVNFKERPSILVFNSEMNASRGVSLNDQRLVDILHIDIGVVAKSRRIKTIINSHRFSTSIIPVKTECSFRCS